MDIRAIACPNCTGRPCTTPLCMQMHRYANVQNPDTWRSPNENLRISLWGSQNKVTRRFTTDHFTSILPQTAAPVSGECDRAYLLAVGIKGGEGLLVQMATKRHHTGVWGAHKTLGQSQDGGEVSSHDLKIHQHSKQLRLLIKHYLAIWVFLFGRNHSHNRKYWPTT